MFKFTGINRMMLWLPCLFFKMPIYTYKLWVSLNEKEKSSTKCRYYKLVIMFVYISTITLTIYI